MNTNDDILLNALEIIAGECERMRIGQIGAIRPGAVARDAIHEWHMANLAERCIAIPKPPPRSVMR